MGRAEPLIVDARRDGAWTRVVIDGAPANLLTDDVVSALRRAVDSVPDSGPSRMLSIEGAGDHFSYGASVEEHLPDRIPGVLPGFHALTRALVDAPVVTVALVRGHCLGGGFELALACDLVFAADDARLGLPEIGLGVFPPVAATLLPSRVGSSRAIHAIVSGESRRADEWASAGVVHDVVPATGLDTAVEAWFDRHLAARSAEALRHAVLAARGETRRLLHEQLPVVERRYLDDLMRSVDACEGVRAFLEHRTPSWRHA